MTLRAVALATVLVGVLGCHARLDGGANNNSGVDAPTSIQIDGSSSLDPDAASIGNPDATTSSACANGRVVYLNFEGVTLTQGTSDATLDRAKWLGTTSATVPQYRPGVATRAQQILDITNFVKAAVSGIPQVTIVTTRPTAGPYVMIVFGGTRNTVSVPYSGAVQSLDCGDAVKSDVGLVFEDATTTQTAADLALGAIGFGLGLTGTQNSNDCMCNWLNNCQQSSGACSLSPSITADLRCTGQTNPQNEVATFQAFCN
jgi:hypothetical protein